MGTATQPDFRDSNSNGLTDAEQIPVLEGIFQGYTCQLGGRRTENGAVTVHYFALTNYNRVRQSGSFN